MLPSTTTYIIHRGEERIEIEIDESTLQPLFEQDESSKIFLVQHSEFGDQKAVLKKYRNEDEFKIDKARWASVCTTLSANRELLPKHHIVPLLAYGTFDGTFGDVGFFEATPRFHGGSLAAWCSIRREEGESTVALEAALLRMTEQVANALAFYHAPQTGISFCHRDVAARNIFCVNDSLTTDFALGDFDYSGNEAAYSGNVRVTNGTLRDRNTRELIDSHPSRHGRNTRDPEMRDFWQLGKTLVEAVWLIQRGNEPEPGNVIPHTWCNTAATMREAIRQLDFPVRLKTVTLHLLDLDSESRWTNVHIQNWKALGYPSDAALSLLEHRQNLGNKVEPAKRRYVFARYLAFPSIPYGRLNHAIDLLPESALGEQPAEVATIPTLWDALSEEGFSGTHRLEVERRISAMKAPTRGSAEMLRIAQLVDPELPLVFGRFSAQSFAEFNEHCGKVFSEATSAACRKRLGWLVETGILSEWLARAGGAEADRFRQRLDRALKVLSDMNAGTSEILAPPVDSFPRFREKMAIGAILQRGFARASVETQHYLIALHYAWIEADEWSAVFWESETDSAPVVIPRSRIGDWIIAKLDYSDELRMNGRLALALGLHMEKPMQKSLNYGAPDLLLTTLVGCALLRDCDAQRFENTLSRLLERLGEGWECVERWMDPDLLKAMRGDMLKIGDSRSAGFLARLFKCRKLLSELDTKGTQKIPIWLGGERRDVMLWATVARMCCAELVIRDCFPPSAKITNVQELGLWILKDPARADDFRASCVMGFWIFANAGFPENAHPMELAWSRECMPGKEKDLPHTTQVGAILAGSDGSPIGTYGPRLKLSHRQDFTEAPKGIDGDSHTFEEWRLGEYGGGDSTTIEIRIENCGNGWLAGKVSTEGEGVHSTPTDFGFIAENCSFSIILKAPRVASEKQDGKLIIKCNHLDRGNMTFTLPLSYSILIDKKAMTARAVGWGIAGALIFVVLGLWLDVIVARSSMELDEHGELVPASEVAENLKTGRTIWLEEQAGLTPTTNLIDQPVVGDAATQKAMGLIRGPDGYTISGYWMQATWGIVVLFVFIVFVFLVVQWSFPRKEKED